MIPSDTLWNLSVMDEIVWHYVTQLSSRHHRSKARCGPLRVSAQCWPSTQARLPAPQSSPRHWAASVTLPTRERRRKEGLVKEIEKYIIYLGVFIPPCPASKRQWVWCRGWCGVMITLPMKQFPRRARPDWDSDLAWCVMCSPGLRVTITWSVHPT